MNWFDCSIGMDIFFKEGVVLDDIISEPYDADPEVMTTYEAFMAGDRSLAWRKRYF